MSAAAEPPPDPDRPAAPDPARPELPPDITVAPPPGGGRLRRSPILPLAIAVVAVLTGSTLFVSGYTMGRQATADPGTPTSDIAAFEPFWDTYHTIRDRYAGSQVSRDAVISGAIRGMIDALGDPYSSYLSSADYRNALLSVNGQYEGIGAEIATQATDGAPGCTPIGSACRLVITRPIPGSPAATAGVQAGDIVVAADGAPLDGLTLDAARDRFRGARGTVVTLTIDRAAAKAPVLLSITRDVVQQEEVVSQVLAGGTVGYVRLNTFSDKAAAELATDFADHVAAGRTKLILDLRGNLGGYVTAARAVASQFIGSGVLFWQQDADGNQVATNAAPGGVATAANLRIVCLIDGGSASASEIVAGALQDSKRATLIGQRSYGKGTIQQWQELTGQAGAFKLTIARWLTPDKRWIHGVGLTPDVPVATPSDTPVGDDPILETAVEILGGQGVQPTSKVAA
jgi:carboxyl-terminal processing protease